MIKRYRRKTPSFEAIQWNGRNLDEVKELVGAQRAVGLLDNGEVAIKDADGSSHFISADGYVFKTAASDEVYVMDREYFEATYEETDQEIRMPLQNQRERRR